MVTSVSSSFSPHVPPFTESFFEPDPLTVEAEVFSSNKLIPDLTPVNNLIFDDQGSAWIHFIDECIENNYQPSVYGTICPNHPDAIHPYPGSIPHNPHDQKTPFTQFVQRGLSKKFREEERNYKNDLRHWQARLNEHLLEIPKLKSDDAIFVSFMDLLLGDFKSAYNYAEAALKLHPFQPNALAIKIICLFEFQDHKNAQSLINHLQQIKPSEPLGELGHELLDSLSQQYLNEVYAQACHETQLSLKQVSHLPYETNYLENQIQKNLKKALKALHHYPEKNFLEHLCIYVLEKTLKVGSSLHAQQAFGYAAEIFNHLYACLDLIKKEPKNISPALNDLLKQGVHHLNSEQLLQLIKHLSTPLEHGNKQMKREYARHIMAMKLNQVLIEKPNLYAREI